MSELCYLNMLYLCSQQPVLQPSPAKKIHVDIRLEALMPRVSYAVPFAAIQCFRESSDGCFMKNCTNGAC